MKIWYAAYLRLCPPYSANHMSPFCGHICRKGHSQIGTVLICVHKRERERAREISKAYTAAISHTHVFSCHLFICMAVTDLIMTLALLQPILPMQHSGMGFSASVRLFCMPRGRTRTPARVAQLLLLSAAVNMTETIALIIRAQIEPFVCSDWNAVSCMECFNCRLANEGLIKRKETTRGVCRVRDFVILGIDC